jgi:gas vesicle protein
MTYDDDNGGGRQFAAGLLIGALLGAGVALLFAPQSGEDTRRLIRKKAKRLAAGAQDRFDDVKDRIRQARRKAEDALSD